MLSNVTSMGVKRTCTPQNSALRGYLVTSKSEYQLHSPPPPPKKKKKKNKKNSMDKSGSSICCYDGRYHDHIYCYDGEHYPSILLSPCVIMVLSLWSAAVNIYGIHLSLNTRNPISQT